MLATTLSRIWDSKSYRLTSSSNVLTAGQWRLCTSELPLVAEFNVRRGDTQSFIAALDKVAPSPGLTLLLVQLGDMIAFNFPLFTDEQYTQLQAAVDRIGLKLSDLRRIARTGSTIESYTLNNVYREAPALCNSVSEACRKARYLHLRGTLLLGTNSEINQDKNAVRTFLEKMGFPELLIRSLDEAERLYREGASPFDLKSGLGHLRSFLESLHLQACGTLQKKAGGSVPTRWGEALKYLSAGGILTRQEEGFAAQLYTLMSDSGIHPLIAEREYARLMRNMSIEYGLLLLTKLSKSGLM